MWGPNIDDGALDVGDRSPLVDLASAHPQDVAGAQRVVGEVDGVQRRAALDVDEQVEVQALGGEELVRSAAVTDPSQGVHLDVAHSRLGREEAHSAD